MSVVIYALSGLLVLAGSIAIVTGSQVVHLEQGWTAIIAGSVAVVGGCVLFGIGAVLQGLRGLRVALLAAQPASAPAAVPPQSGELPPVVVAAPSLAAPVEPPRPRAAMRPSFTAVQAELPAVPEPAREARPREVALREVPARETPAREAPAIASADDAPEPAEAVPTPPFPVADSRLPLSARKRPNFLSNFLARTAERGPDVALPPNESGGSVQPVLTPVSDRPTPRAPLRTSVDLSSGWSEMADDRPQGEAPSPPARADGGRVPERAAAPAAVPEAPRPGPAMPPAANLPAADTPPRPTVVGRYNAGSASYVLYSTGMIEVETEGGTHQFESMQDLKAFIERQEGAKA